MSKFHPTFCSLTQDESHTMVYRHSIHQSIIAELLSEATSHVVLLLRFAFVYIYIILCIYIQCKLQFTMVM